MPNTIYKNIRNKLKFGDLVLFSSRGFVPALIKLGTLSKWTHIGMVISLPGFDGKLLFESTGLSKTKTIDGKIKKGVQISLLSSRIEQFKGVIAVRHLNAEITEQMFHNFERFRLEVQDRAYEKNLLDLLSAAIDIPFLPMLRGKPNLKTIFCSELIAEAYMVMGLLPYNKFLPSDEYTPADFTNIKLINASLSSLIYIK